MFSATASSCFLRLGALLASLLGTGAALAQTLEVVTVPWTGDPNQPHQVYTGGDLVLHGVANLAAGCSITAASWDPGDGSGPQAIPTGNPRALELTHTYAATAGTPFVATLSVTDSCGNTETDTFRVVVLTQTLDVEVNMAIDSGLWALYKRQILGMSGTVDTGSWLSQDRAADTASAVLAFEINGHLETGNRAENPYVDTVARGIAHLMTELTSFPIVPQTAGDPDVNGNGIALESTTGGRPTYVGGQVMDAIIATGTPATVATTGGTDVLGRTYGEIVQDLSDAYSFGQGEFAPAGSWQYSWNAFSGDNSAAQWWAIGTLGIERQVDFAAVVSVPQFVKDENLAAANFLLNSQTFDGSNAGDDGRFGYTSTFPIDVNGMNTTPSGVVQLTADGVDRNDARHLASQRFMNRNWDLLINGNRIYGMFSTSKAMRLAIPTPIVELDGTGAPNGPLDWYRWDVGAGDPINGLARHLVDAQQPNDTWDAFWVFDDIATAWAISILSPTPIQLGPVAVCDAEPEVTGVNVTITLDGTQSFHLDEARTIVAWEWDFTDDGIIDATGPVVQTSYSALGQYNVRLVVTDDNAMALMDDTVCMIDIVPPILPPNSDPGGPYDFCFGVSEPFLLDGSNSSSDVSAPITAWEWDFDPQPLDFDYNDATGPIVDVTAFFMGLGPGTYDVGLRVTASNGQMNEDFTTVTVSDAAACTLPDVGTSYCDPAIANSTGVGAVLQVFGSNVIADNDVILAARDMPAGQIGFFLISDGNGIFMPAASNGNFCLGGWTLYNLGRFDDPSDRFTTSGGGTAALRVDLGNLPTGGGNTGPYIFGVQPGETWNFQGWFRDIPAGNQMNNFTDAVAVTFQ